MMVQPKLEISYRSNAFTKGPRGQSCKVTRRCRGLAFCKFACQKAVGANRARVGPRRPPAPRSTPRRVLPCRPPRSDSASGCSRSRTLAASRRRWPRPCAVGRTASRSRHRHGLALRGARTVPRQRWQAHTPPPAGPLRPVSPPPTTSELAPGATAFAEPRSARIRSQLDLLLFRRSGASTARSTAVPRAGPTEPGAAPGGWWWSRTTRQNVLGAGAGLRPREDSRRSRSAARKPFSGRVQPPRRGTAPHRRAVSPGQVGIWGFQNSSQVSTPAIFGSLQAPHKPRTTSLKNALVPSWPAAGRRGGWAPRRLRPHMATRRRRGSVMSWTYTSSLGRMRSLGVTEARKQVPLGASLSDSPVSPPLTCN